jgi:serine/threonine protein kinase/tetratricopeptide (TPR) repeat protein
LSQPTDPSRDLLVGLLALQTGLIDQGALFAAFAAWTREKGRSLADHLVALGHLDAARRAAVEAIAHVHVQALGGDVEKSLGVVAVGRSTRESLAQAGGPDVTSTLGHVGSAHPSTRDDVDDPDRTSSVSVGSATSDGQRFRIVRPHAKGGLGAVFVALDAELNREVALKQILDRHADDPISRHRFLLEAEVTGGLEHPGIVPIYGLGSYADGRPYYAMRFIRGDTLKEAIDRHHADGAAGDGDRRSLELRKLLRRFLDVCNAIDYAHSRGVLHRDIKPGNIVVGRHGETLVVDWGLAKATGKGESGADERTLVPSSASGSSETLPGSALGTPAYMSPEQARGDLDGLGPRSDVYSLGATLYCLLTGKPPFEGDDLGAILRGVQKGDIVPPRKLDPVIDRALEAICLKAMSHRPEDRYGSCRALADDIERWMADEAVVAWKEPWSRKLVRWLMRHRTGVTAAGAALLMAVAGLGAVSAVQARANGELKRSNDALSTANARVVRANSELKEANENVNRANAELQAANVRERERFDLAMDAIKLFHGEISKDLLLKQDQFKKLRDKLLRGAADFYGRLEGMLKQRTDRESRAALGRAYEELGELTISIGDARDALAVYRKAIDARRDLAEGPAATDAIKLDLARNLRSTGFVLEGMSDRPAARACYDEAAAIVKTLRPADGMTEPVYLVEGRILQSIGWWYHASANEKESVIWLRKACDVVDKGLASRAPGPVSAQDKEALLSLATMLHALSGPLNALGRTVESLSDQERALGIVRELAAADPTDPQVRISHAVTYFNIGGLLRSQDRWSDAFSAYRAGSDIAGKLADEYAGIVDYRRYLAKCQGGCGDCADALGRTEEAIAYSRAAVAAWKKVVDDSPGRYGEPVDLGIAYNRFGWLLFGLGRLDDALEQYEAARATFQKLIDTYPPHVLARTRNELANILINIAEIRRMQGRLAEARVNCDKAIAMREALVREIPQVWVYRYRMCECRLRSGQVKLAAGDIPGAVADFRLALAAKESFPARSGELGMFEAGCHAMLSRVGGVKDSGISVGEGRVEADKAMAILRRTVAEGFRAPELRGESSLEPLRSRPDFQLLMMDVAFPTRPFAHGR